MKVKLRSGKPTFTAIFTHFLWKLGSSRLSSKIWRNGIDRNKYRSIRVLNHNWTYVEILTSILNSSIFRSPPFGNNGIVSYASHFQIVTWVRPFVKIDYVYICSERILIGLTPCIRQCQTRLILSVSSAQNITILTIVSKHCQPSWPPGCSVDVAQCSLANSGSGVTIDLCNS